MMSKRNLVAEIQQKNARSSGRYLHGNLELCELERTVRTLQESDSTLRALHVMGIASCIEVGVREAIKRLVDSGEPYLNRVEFFKDHFRFDFPLTRALGDGQITFGDLVSHSLPVSNLTHISSHMEILCEGSGQGAGFCKILSKVRIYVSPPDEEIFGDQVPGTAQRVAPFLLDDVEGLLRDIAMTFEVRHLVAHEANFTAVSREDLFRFIASARSFLDALFELVEQTLNLGVARDGYGGSIQEMAKAGKLVVAAEAVQQKIAEKITSLGREDDNLSDLFSQAADAFGEYHMAEASFYLALHGCATGNAMRINEASVTSKLWSSRLSFLVDLEADVDFHLDL